MTGGAARPGGVAGETDIPGKEHLKGLGQRAGSLLQLLGLGLEEGSVRETALASFCRRGEGNPNQEALRAQGSGLGTNGYRAQEPVSTSPCAWQSPRGTPPAAGSGEPGTGPSEANSPLENQTENSPPGAGRAPAGGAACSLPAPPGSGARGRRFPPNRCLALPGRKDAAIFLLPAANAWG